MDFSWNTIYQKKGAPMGDIFGFLAGGGMVALVAALIVAFLRQMGWMKPDAARLLGGSALMTCCAGIIYLMAALLFHLAVYGSIENEMDLSALFHGPYMRTLLPALSGPEGVGPVSAVFAWLAYALGSVLFGQYEFSGMLLAWTMTGAALFLFQRRFQKITDGKTARDAAFLLLCLPGGVFFLLPGWAPLCLLICAIAFYLVGRRLPAWKPRLSPVGYGWALSLCAVLSAAVTVCLAEGRIG
ncbi:MAG: hypothetical protein IJS41_01650 [Clostridia bacterium]|nr:hypothetical protein [Clostridia bacterium]